MIQRLFLLLLLTHPGWAQVKVESEFRIRPDEVPAAARRYVDALAFQKKVRWYREIGLRDTTVEAKTRHQGNRYSVEFAADGTPQDIEVSGRWQDIPPSVRRNMVAQVGAHLQADRRRFCVEKVQRQYVGQEAMRAVRDLATAGGFRYEIVVSAREDDVYRTYEFLLSEQGDFLGRAEIMRRNADHLVY